MAKVHKTLRLESAVADRVSTHKEEGESDSAVYVRVIVAGLDAMEQNDATGARISPDNDPERVNTQQPSVDALNELLAAKDETIGALQSSVDILTAQVATKDDQIAKLTKLTDQAQQLQAITEAKALPAKTGISDRIKDFFFKGRSND